MSLPANFLEELRARTPLPALVGRRVRLSRSGRQLKGCCPFHGEKTPSFYVYDDHFHCFGCGAHGDAISFVMQSEGATFPEAVQRLAAEAGLSVPAPSPEAAQAEARRRTLHEVLEAAQSLFTATLETPEGARGLAYLRARGLGDATISAWGIGFAPADRTALPAALHKQGIDPQAAIAAGLMATPESGPPRVFFQDRITFPIRDARGRLISFGARTLTDAQPKYLNGPETDIFRKRHALFGQDRARAALRGTADLLVVEGYLDVIALHEAGFPGALAPLGTALTQAQWETLWSLHKAPILCFDGDKAGARATARAIGLAVPHLSPECSFRVIRLPPGHDPDSFVRQHGAPGLRRLIATADGVTEALYATLAAATPGTGPEAKATLHRALRDAAATVKDALFGAELRHALLQKFFAGRRGQGSRASAPAPLRATPPPPAAEQQRNLLAIALGVPAILPHIAEAFPLVDLPHAAATLRDAALAWAESADPPLDSTRLMTHLTTLGLAGEATRILADTPLPTAAMNNVLPAEAEARWWHFFNLLDIGGLDTQVEQARRDFIADPCPRTEKRLTALRDAQLRRGDIDQDFGGA